MIGIGIAPPIMLGGPHSGWSPLDVPGMLHWWAAEDLADGANLPVTAPWVDRIAGAVATQVSPLWRNGSIWNGRRTLRGTDQGQAGSSVAYIPASDWTLPGAGVAVIHAFRADAPIQGFEWVCLASGNNPVGLSHRQWGLRGASFGDGVSPGPYAWNKNDADVPATTGLLVGAPATWTHRILTAFCATSGQSMSVACVTDAGTYSGVINAAGYAGNYSPNDGNGRILGSGAGTQHGLLGELADVWVVAGMPSSADLRRLAQYSGVWS